MCTMKPYGMLKLQNSLVKSVYYEICARLGFYAA